MHAPLINIAIAAARAGGKIIMQAADRLSTVKIAEKKPNDFVTEIDQKVEKEIILHIKKAYPKHGIIGEEYGTQEGQVDYQWIIDPIDGTRNFIHGFPYFAISIAIMHKNKIEHGVVYDPVRQELFTASRGKGAQLNDRRIRVGQSKHLQTSLIGIGSPHATNDFQKVMIACGDARRAGAAALDLAYVAAGRLDGFLEYHLRIWDIAAGILLIKEAGGLVCDSDGGESYLKTGNVVAGNAAILKQLLKVSRSAVRI